MADQLTMLYDGLCPLCSREVRMLRRKDKHDRLAFVDIAEQSFDPSTFGITHADAHAAMHVQLPDGTMVKGVEAFRQVYRALGMGWVMAPTGWPILRPIFDLLYRGFAKIRPRLQRKACATDRCAPKSQ
jgi:predicted DCC family thiol-disulfide oxidoreductase YuxK